MIMYWTVILKWIDHPSDCITARFSFSLFWFANWTALLRRYPLNKHIVQQRGTSRGCVWKFMRTMRMTISNNAWKRRKTYNGSLTPRFISMRTKLLKSFLCLYLQICLLQKNTKLNKLIFDLRQYMSSLSVNFLIKKKIIYTQCL